MATVPTHYETLLAPIYEWMVGGIDLALESGAADVAPFCPPTEAHALAVDLGAGFGMHAIPLARAGYSVLAIDTSALLLETLRAHTKDLNVQAVEADLLTFQAHLTGPASLVLCMGDTLTHLEDEGRVERLLKSVRASLRAGGRFIATFRDYSVVPAGNARFIAVRNDADRIHTCFLEQHARHVTVHDILHERNGESWQMRVSSYRKLRLAPEAVVQALERVGMTAVVGDGPRGMVRLSATRL